MMTPGASGPAMIRRMFCRLCHHIRLHLRYLLITATLLAYSQVSSADGIVYQVDLEGALGVATAEYIITGIETANKTDANAIIIRMDLSLIHI